MKKSMGAKTIGTPTPVWVVGSYDESGKANLMTAAWGGICCSEPPCITVSLRKARHSYDSIIKRGAFTVSIPSNAHMKETDYVGIVSGANRDKFQETELTPVRSETVDAPYVSQFPVVIECRLINTIELGIHTQFIGEIMDIKADESVLGVNGLPDLCKMGAVIYDPGQKSYLEVGHKVADAFSIGKPDNMPEAKH